MKGDVGGDPMELELLECVLECLSAEILTAPEPAVPKRKMTRGLETGLDVREVEDPNIIHLPNNPLRLDLSIILDRHKGEDEIIHREDVSTEESWELLEVIPPPLEVLQREIS